MEYVLVTSMIVGVVELVKRLFARDYRAAAIILAAALTGAVAGAFDVESATVVEGIVIGFAASGLITTAQAIGKSGE